MPSFNLDAQVREIHDFYGSATLTDSYDVAPDHALASQNVRYVEGAVATRLGHAVGFSASQAATNLYNWLYVYLGQYKNVLLYHKAGVGIRYVDLGNLGAGASTVVAETGAAGASMAAIGQHVYVAFHDANGIGIAAGQVYGYGITIGADKLFQGPITTIPTFSEPGAGLITAGPHNIGYLIETRNGFITRPSPSVLDSFVPAITTASGGKSLQISLNTTWPEAAWKVHVVMSTVANPDQYYLVPDASVAVPGGSSFSVTLSISISDDDLAATGADAAPYLSLLTQTTSGAEPFKPSDIIIYSNRAVYITRDALGTPGMYISEPSNYQSLTADQHWKPLPGNLPPVTGFVLRNTLYILGPHWTFSLNDTGAKPVEWPQPEVIDRAIGTLTPNGVCVDSSQGYAWVADTGGLYLYQGGPYPARPVSYYQTPDWNRINWNAPTKIFVVDDKDKKEVSVLAPLGSATEPTHWLTWNYTKGADADTVKFSINDFGGFTPGCCGIIQNDTTKRLEPWFGCSAAGPIVRRRDLTDATPYRDLDNDGDPTAIDCPYETALLPGLDAPRGQINMPHAARLRIRGSGSLLAKVWTLDHSRSVTPNGGEPIVLSDTPGKEITLRIRGANAEQASLEIRTNGVDEWFYLSKLDWCYTEGPMQR